MSQKIYKVPPEFAARARVTRAGLRAHVCGILK